MARIKFSELAKQTMTPESIARSRKAAIKELATMELAELRDTLKVYPSRSRGTLESFPGRKYQNSKSRIETFTLISFDQSCPRWAETSLSSRISRTGRSNSAILAKQEISTVRKCAGKKHLLRRYGHCIPDRPNRTSFRRIGP